MNKNMKNKDLRLEQTYIMLKKKLEMTKKTSQV